MPEQGPYPDSHQCIEAVRADMVQRINAIEWLNPVQRMVRIADIDAKFETYRYAMGEAEARAAEFRRADETGIPPAETVRRQVANPALLWNPGRNSWEVFQSVRQNRSGVVRSADGRTRPDPLQARDYQERVGRVQRSLESADARTARGVSEDGRAIPGADPARAAAAFQEQARQALSVSGVRLAKKPAKNADFGAFKMTVETPFDLPPDLRRALTHQDPKREHNTTIGFDIVRNGEDLGRNKAPDGRPDGVHIKWSSVADELRGSGAGAWLYRQIVDWAYRETANQQGADVHSGRDSQGAGAPATGAS